MSAINRTGIVLSANDVQYTHNPLVSGNCLRMQSVNDHLGPISFAWNTSYTLFLRANIYSIPNSAARIISDPTSGQQIIMTGNTIRVTNKFANGDGGANLITLNEMHDYALVYDGTFGIVQFFKDGVPHSSALLAVPFTSVFGYYIFNRSDGLRNCDMDVCELQWYNRAFTPVEIARHYRSDPNNLDSLIFRYKLNEGSGSVAHPSFGIGSNLTITGGSWSTFSTPSNLSTYGDTLITGSNYWKKQSHTTKKDERESSKPSGSWDKI